MEGNFAAAEAELNEGGYDDSEGSEWDHENAVPMKAIPRAVVSVDADIDVWTWADPADAENIVTTDGRSDSIQVFGKNPSVLDGDVYRSIETDKLYVGTDDSPVFSTKTEYDSNGDEVGIELSYYNQKIAVEGPLGEDELPDEVSFTFTSWEGIRAARLLDANGANNASTSDAANVRGLVERAGDGADEEDETGKLINPPRLARWVVLRDDLEDPLTFFWRNADTGGQFPTKKLDIFTGEVFDDDGALTQPLRFADNPDAIDPESVKSDLRWSHSGGETTTDDAGSSGDDMSNNPFAEADSGNPSESSPSDEDDDTLAWGDLSEEQQSFVHSAIVYLQNEEMGVDDIDFDAIYQRNVDDADKPLTGEYSAAEYKQMVDDRIVD